MTDYCATCDEPAVGGFPSLPPPCSSRSCSIGPVPLDETNGTASWELVTRGDGGRTRTVTLETGDPSEGGVLACFVDADGNEQGVDVVLAGNPAPLDGVDCFDPVTGANLYSNPVREIKGSDGNYSLGALPFPVNDIVCTTVDGCETYYPAPSSQESLIWENCGPSICAEITNTACYPMVVKPSLEIVGSEITGPAQIEYQPNEASGEGFGSKLAVSRGVWTTCEETSTAGSGVTGSGGGGDTGTGGDDNHTHSVAGHTHTGPGHAHDTNCVTQGGGLFSGTVPFAPKTIDPGETYSFCVDGSVRFLDPDWDEVGVINYGTVRLCLQGQSVVNADTIAALEGN